MVALARPRARASTTPTTPDRSKLRLHEVTRLLVKPVDIATSLWPDIRHICFEDLGIELDMWQDGAAGLILAVRDDGKLAHTIDGVGMSLPRQVGKTFLLAAVIFTLCVAYPNLLVIWSAHHSKALDCLTELLTANRGWITMGTAREGDEVFHPSGRKVKIIGTSDVNLNHDCYEVIMTDGSRVVADAGHLWTVVDKYRKASSGSGSNRKRWLTPPETITTLEMYRRGVGSIGTVRTRGKEYRTGKYRFVLPRRHCIEDLPEQDLPIDPYLFGAWLGDGCSTSSSLTCAAEDLIHWSKAIGEAGYLAVARKPAKRAWRIAIRSAGNAGLMARNFRGKLFALGVLGDKHVPEQYLTGSVKQRLALLQGLLDTDGSINCEGTVYFTSTKQALSESVLFLTRSLGWKATINEGKSALNGKDCGPIWRVTFTPKLSDGMIPFRLQRKASRILDGDTREGRFTVSVKSIEPVATRPVRCIKVESEDGLFLAGRDLIPTHNTHMETFMSMQGFAKRTKVDPFIEKIYTGSGDEEIRFHNGSRILFGARERGFGRGIPGVDVLVSDEGQILSERALQNMLATLNTSQFGLHIYCGTPPYPEDNSESFTRMRDEAMSGQATNLLWIECGAETGADIDDPATYLVNPSYPHRTPIESILRLRKKLSEDGFKKEGLGIWDVTGDGPFDLVAWNRLAELDWAEPDQVALMIDVSPDRRWSSIAVAGEGSDDRTLVMVHEVRGTSQTVPLVMELLESKNILEVAIFGGGGARVLEPDLVKAGIEYEKLTAADMAAAYGNLQKQIREGTIAHVDQPELKFAIANAQTRWLQSGEAEAFDRRGHGVNISPVVAVAGALYRYGLSESALPVIL